MARSELTTTICPQCFFLHFSENKIIAPTPHNLIGGCGDCITSHFLNIAEVENINRPAPSQVCADLSLMVELEEKSGITKVTKITVINIYFFTL